MRGGHPWYVIQIKPLGATHVVPLCMFILHRQFEDVIILMLEMGPAEWCNRILPYDVLPVLSPPFGTVSGIHADPLTV